MLSRRRFGWKRGKAEGFGEEATFGRKRRFLSRREECSFRVGKKKPVDKTGAGSEEKTCKEKGGILGVETKRGRKASGWRKGW